MPELTKETKLKKKIKTTTTATAKTKQKRVHRKKSNSWAKSPHFMEITH